MRGPGPRLVAAALAATVAAMLDCRSAATQESQAPAEKPMRSFALYVLSRGKGVPPEASQALRRLHELAEKDRAKGVEVRIDTKRIGLEGEQRLCVEYRDPEAARRLHARAKELVAGVDLARLVIEPCSGKKPQDAEPKQEGKP